MSDRYEAARAGFDQLAAQYDADMRRQDAILDRYRRVQREAVIRHVPADAVVLELGCGTGEETRFLAARGWRVIATDVAPEMVRRTQAKLEREGHFAVLRPGGAAQVVAALADEGVRVDAVVSSLGPLNCEPEIEALGEGLRRLLPNGAPLILSPMARWCPWEIVALAATGHPRQAVRRLGRGPKPVPVGDTTVPVWYFDPDTLIRRLGPGFRRLELRGLGVFLPPPWLHRLSAIPGLLDGLDRLDGHLAHRPALRHLGDHSLIVLERT